MINNMNNNDYRIFKYINPYGNDMFSKMKGLDLQDLIYYTNKFYLEKRNNLMLKENIDFGIEIECENAKKENIRKEIRSALPNWKITNDTSLDLGREIISPILHDDEKSWKEIQNACNIVKRNATIGKNCGGHIHIDASVLGSNPSSWTNLIYLWTTYENIIYRFSYGEFLNPRASINRYAPPISSKEYKEKINSFDKDLGIYQIIIKSSMSKFTGLNLYNVKNHSKKEPNNTIEFRCPNGTLDDIIWQNNLCFFGNILLYSKNNNFDYDTLAKREEKNKNKYNNLELYNEIYLPESLELCDMLFDKNIDKVYFLRQYLKSYETTNNKELTKAKQFTLH